MARGRHLKSRRPVIYKVALPLLMALGLLLFAGQFGLIGFRAFAVQSNSMEPAIKRNSVVLTLPATPEVDDVVTYALPDEPEILITHRIVEVAHEDGTTLYVTKGDANDVADEDPLTRDSIVGEVWLTLPWVGAVVNLARTDIGFILLIIIPGTIIVYHEVLSLKQQLTDRRRASRATAASPPSSSAE